MLCVYNFAIVRNDGIDGQNPGIVVKQILKQRPLLMQEWTPPITKDIE